ncbi:MAG: F0F1 ATP synthase subunit delta [Dokdonella sp.]
MSSPLALARPYARAAFELAQSNGTLADWARKIAFAAQVAAEPQVASLFGNPKLTEAQLASLFVPDGEAADSSFSHFIQILADNGRLVVLPEVGALFEELKLDAERVLKVNVRTAAPIDTGEIEKIEAALKRRFNRDIELSQSVDPEIIGGAIIDAGDVVIDGSVRGRLARLEHALTH